MKIQLGNYDDWAEYLSEWAEYDWSADKPQYSIDCKPDEILLAYYSYEDYSGDALCFYRIGDTYYEVNGGHCSCYGLENQWEPEDRGNKEVFLESLKKRMTGYNYGAERKYIPQVIKLLEENQ